MGPITTWARITNPQKDNQEQIDYTEAALKSIVETPGQEGVVIWAQRIRDEFVDLDWFPEDAPVRGPGEDLVRDRVATLSPSIASTAPSVTRVDRKGGQTAPYPPARALSTQHAVSDTAPMMVGPEWSVAPLPDRPPPLAQRGCAARVQPPTVGARRLRRARPPPTSSLRSLTPPLRCRISRLCDGWVVHGVSLVAGWMMLAGGCPWFHLPRWGRFQL